jgi:F0F1-type ATP synthase assembly protein I
MSSMPPEPRTYKPGQWLLWGAALGAFIGLLLDKFAIGLIAGFFVGVLVDKARQKAPAGKQDGDRADE